MQTTFRRRQLRQQRLLLAAMVAAMVEAVVTAEYMTELATATVAAQMGLVEMAAASLTAPREYACTLARTISSF